MVFPDVGGQTLRQLLREQGQLSPARASTFLLQLLRILRAIHRRGGIHRDIKPENVLITPDDQVKLIDFGLGQLAGRFSPERQVENSLRTARDATTAGTLGYQAPEERRGDRPTAQTDLYATGILLFEMLTGHLPDRLQLPSQFLPGLPPLGLDDYFRQTCCRRSQRFVRTTDALRAARKLAAASQTGYTSAHQLTITQFQPALFGPVHDLTLRGDRLLLACPEAWLDGALIELHPSGLKRWAAHRRGTVRRICSTKQACAVLDQEGRIALRTPADRTWRLLRLPEPTRRESWCRANALTIRDHDLAVGMSNGELLLIRGWDVPRRQVLSRRCAQHAVQVVQFVADTGHLLSLDSSGSIQLLCSRTLRVLARERRDAPIDGMWIGPNHDSMVVSSRSVLSRHCTATLNLLTEQRMPARVLSLAAGPEDRWLFTGDRHGRIRIHQPLSLQPITVLHQADQPVVGLVAGRSVLHAALEDGSLITLGPGPRPRQSRKSRQLIPTPRQPKMQDPPIRFRRNQRIGGYRLLSLAGRGSVGEVWKALAPDGRVVALKLANDNPLGELLIRSARYQMAFGHHPGVVPVESVSPGPPAHAVMPWGGELTLRDVIDTPTRRNTALPLAHQLCDILCGLSRAGIVHGDLKPENVLVHEDTSGRLALLLTDLGQPCRTPKNVPRTNGAQVKMSLLSEESSQLAGTTPYLSPSRRGGAVATPEDDCFALATILFELFTGDQPDVLELPSDYSAQLPRDVNPDRLDLAYRILCRTTPGQAARDLTRVTALLRPTTGPPPAGWLVRLIQLLWPRWT